MFPYQIAIIPPVQTPNKQCQRMVWYGILEFNSDKILVVI